MPTLENYVNLSNFICHILISRKIVCEHNNLGKVKTRKLMLKNRQMGIE